MSDLEPSRRDPGRMETRYGDPDMTASAPGEMIPPPAPSMPPITKSTVGPPPIAAPRRTSPVTIAIVGAVIAVVALFLLTRVVG